MIGDRRVAAPPATPFRGISPFRYADHAIFCAREAETRRLGQLVTVYRGVLLYGDSGAGKSSLVNAGLISHMTERGLLAQRLRVQPRRGEELVLEPLAISDRGSETLPMLGGGDGENGAVCSAAGFARLVEDACDHVRPLLIFDQFEEIVTLFEEAGAEDLQRDVLRLIVELIHSSLPVKVLLVFREDYLGRIKELLTDCPDLVDQALRLAAPQRDALDTIIRGPFERNPGCFSHELSPSLAARLRELLGERFGSGEVSLSEVQTVCLRLWQSSDPDRLLEERGIQGLLEDYLGEELDAFQPDLRRAAIALLSQMVTSAGTRNVITAEDLLDRVQAEEEIPRPRLELALAQLEGTSRLVRRERRRHLDLYEITSEFLVPWISERRELQRRQQERRRLRVLAGLLGVGLLVLVIVGALALWALSQRNAARRSATAATALDLSVASRAQLDGRLDVALLLALDAYLTSPRFETWSSLVGALETARESGALAILHGHEDFVRSVAVSPDGKTIASGGNDGTVRVWSVAAHRQVALLARAHRSVIASIDYSPDGRLLAAGGGDGVVSLWDVARRRLAGRQPPRQPHDVTALAFSPGGHMLATAASDGTLRLWDVAGRQPIGQPFGYVHGALTSVAWSPDSRLLASGGSDDSVRLWSVTNGLELGPPLRGHTREVTSVAFSPDGRTLASGADDSTVRLWDVAARRPLGAPITAYAGDVSSVAFSPDGGTLAYGADDGTVQLWSVTRQESAGPALARHTGPVTSVAFSSDGHLLVSGGRDETVRLWQMVPRPSFDEQLLGHVNAVLSVALARDGDTVASGGLDTTVRLWSLARGEQLGERLLHEHGAVASVALDRSGRLLAAGTTDHAVRLWSVSSHTLIGPPLRGHTGDLTSVAFSPDDRMLASSAYDGTVRLWDLRTHEQIARLPRTTADVIRSVAFSPDDRTLAGGGGDGEVELWSVATRRLAGRPLAGHTDAVTTVAFSPDGRTLASGGADDTIRLWRVATRRQIGQPLFGHTGSITGVAFSADSRTLASSAYDATVRLWDVAARRPIGQPLRSGIVSLTSVALNRDGTTVVAGGLDGRVWFWRNVFSRRGATLRTIVCRRVGSGLDRREWAQYVPGLPYRRLCAAD